MAARSTASPLGYVRAGIIVPKFAHTAVERNKLKRQLRELARVALLPLVSSCDVVLRVRAEAYRRSFDELRRDIHSVGEQLVGIYGGGPR